MAGHWSGAAALLARQIRRDRPFWHLDPARRCHVRPVYLEWMRLFGGSLNNSAGSTASATANFPRILRLA